MSRNPKRKRILDMARGARLYAVSIAVPLVLFSTVLATARISGSSMAPYLKDGDFVLCMRHFSPDYGDIVLFDNDGRVLVKRVEGLPGDTVGIRGGVLYRNGEPVDEPYLGRGVDAGSDFEGTPVPDGAVFVLGDNRYESMDSRSENVGNVRSGSIIGKMVCKLGWLP